MNALIQFIEENSTSFLGMNPDILAVRNMPTYTWGPVKHETKESDLLCYIVGEVLGKDQGTKLGAAGNRVAKEGVFFTPMKDGESVQDVVAIGPVTNPDRRLLSLWEDQDSMLNNIQVLDNVVDEVEGQSPTKFVGWRDAYNSNNGLSVCQKILWEKYVRVGSEDERGKDKSVVYETRRYHPEVLRDYSAAYFDLKADALKQHNIIGVNDKLIPPWELSDKLRPGTVAAFLVSLHCKNIYNDRKDPHKGFVRSYEIRGHGAKVFIESAGEPEHLSRVRVPQGYGRRWMAEKSDRTLEYFNGFSIKKRD